jgi:alpha-L-rhamnosidase
MVSAKNPIPISTFGVKFCRATLVPPLLTLAMHGSLFAQQSSKNPSTPSTILTMTQLRAGFVAPPPAARMRCYWWWLNGNTDKVTITHDLEEMKAKGFGGALLVDANGSDQGGNHNVPAGPVFGSPAWVELYTHALHEADRLGLEITLNITSGWNLGGPDVTPDQASKLLTWTRTDMSGDKHIEIQLPAPASLNGYSQQIAVLAYPLRHGTQLAPQLSAIPLRMRIAAAETGFSMPNSTAMLNDGESEAVKTNTTAADTSLEDIRDISSYVHADTLTWDAPAGDWEVLRIGYTDSDARVSTASGAWQGLAIDYLSRDAFNTYWNHTVEPLLAASKPFHSLKYLATDSWELGGTNWTQTFAQEFKNRRGYDPVPWLPVVAGRIVGSRDNSTRFLTDLRRTVADLIVANHYDVFAERAAEHGLGVQAESGGPHGAPMDALETFRSSAVPQSEFWSVNPHRSKDEERFFTKEAASAANIYGQRFVAQEGETSIGPQWSESLSADLKPSFDMAITEGMNRLVWHEFTSSPASTGLPGQEYFAGTHLNPKVTWWNAGDAFFTYLNRVQFMMQQGTPVNDVLYFYGDNVPNFVRLKADDPAHVLPGYDYDVTNEDALLHTIHSNGSTLTGPSAVTWRALVLPQSSRFSLSALKQIERYVQDGGTVVGKIPTSPTGMVRANTQSQFDALVRAIWGESCRPGSNHLYGKGHVYCTQDAHTALEAMHVLPDVTLSSTHPKDQSASSDTNFDYAHRRVGKTDIYFVRNGSNATSHHNVIFRARGTVELWNAVTGEIHRLQDAVAMPDGRTRIQLDLTPFGSAFVLFSPEPVTGMPDQPTRERAETLVTNGPWTTVFQANRGAPTNPVTMSDLKSWSEWPDAGIRYFSGTATYRASAIVPDFTKGEHVLLQFSEVREIAHVKVNGHDAGTVWSQPLTLRVDPWLKPGMNTIEIEVTNLWPNRIIGDLQPGTSQHYTATNITAYHANSPLLPSGLIGPLHWVIQK